MEAAPLRGSDLLALLGLRPSDWIRVDARVGSPDGSATSPYDVELAAVAGAVPARQAEFLTGRHLARQALAAIGIDAAAIDRRPDRSPDWPAGVLGSITHTTGLCAAVVGQRDPHAEPPVAGIGIDAEVDAELAPGIVDRVLTGAERAALGERLATDAVVAFSAKEAVFKAINPSSGAWLEPNEVELRLSRDHSGGPGGSDGGAIAVTSWAHPVPGLRPEAVVGRWARFGPWIVTGIVAHAG